MSMRWLQLPLFPFSPRVSKTIEDKPYRPTIEPTTLCAKSEGKAPIRPKPSSHQDDPDLKRLWNEIAVKWFPTRPDLFEYRVHWSVRSQKRTLASCNLNQRRVVVARELQPASLNTWLPALLYHEMCHAVIGFDIQKKDGKRLWHGKQFKNLEKQNPAVAELEKWIKQGGWATAVRSDRARRAYEKRQVQPRAKRPTQMTAR
jgi:hypothetical protein